MPQQITDLDAILKPAKQVRIGGKVYKLPPGIPVELFLRVNQAAEEDTPDQQSIADLCEDVLKLFQWGQPDMKELPEGMLLDQVLALVGVVYGEDAPQEADPPSRAGTPSTRRRPSRSAS